MVWPLVGVSKANPRSTEEQVTPVRFLNRGECVVMQAEGDMLGVRSERPAALGPRCNASAPAIGWASEARPAPSTIRHPEIQ